MLLLGKVSLLYQDLIEGEKMRYLVIVLVTLFALTGCSGKVGEGFNDIINTGKDAVNSEGK